MTGWFPQLSPNGVHILAESGDGWVTVGGSKVVQGFAACWVDDERFLYSNDSGVWLYSLRVRDTLSRAHPKPLMETAACPTLWAGRDPSENLRVVSDGRRIPNAGQPAISTSGKLIYRTGDDKVEPSICETASAWGDGGGRIYGVSS